MSYAIGRLFAFTVFLLGLSGVASAAPPASCVNKFVGTWSVTVLATGQTYPAVISPNGTTHVTCPMCNPAGTWTCNGNTIMINAPAPVSHTLSADGRTMSGGCCTLTRMGSAPVAANVPSAQPKGEPIRTAKAGSARQSCSDITGVGGAPVNCPQPKSRQFEQPKQANRQAPTREIYGPPSPGDDPAVALIGRILDESRRGPPAGLNTPLPQAAAPLRPQADPPQQANSAERAANLRTAETYLEAAQSTYANNRTCAGWRAAAENYMNAGRFLLRADLIDRANEALARATALGDAVDTADREGRCAGSRRQASVASPASRPVNESDLTTGQCQEALAHLRAAGSRSDMRSLGERGAMGSNRRDDLELSVLKVKLAARGCRDPNAPLTLRECLAAEIQAMDVLSREESDRQRIASGCNALR